MAAAQDIFRIERRDDGVALVRFAVPGARQNVLNRAFMNEADACLDTLAEDRELVGVVFISDNPGSFIAGADIEMLHACGSADDVTALSRSGQAFCDRIAALRVPVVAAIHGTCLGGGLEFALACHGRVCTDAPATALGVPEVMLGLLPGSGGTQRLPRQVGLASALDLALTGRQVAPRSARRMGLVDDVVAPPLLETAALKRLHELNGKARQRRRRGLVPTLLDGNPLGRRVVLWQARRNAQARSRGNYPALPRIIECMETGLARGMRAGLETEARRFGELAMTPEARQLMGVHFATTELKKETGTDNGADARPVRRVAVLGAGLMGAGIAFVTSHKAGLPVRLKDVAAEGLNRGMAHIHKELQARRQRRRITPFEAECQRNRITPALNYTGFARVDLVIEAVFEDLGLKHRMIRDVEAHAGPDAIFASNTSSIPISQIAQGAERPQNVIGMHYFSPVEKMPLLEVITTEQTAPEVIATTVETGRRQGKTVIVVRDGAGFYVNRILAPYINEACHLLTEGVEIDHVDRALLDFGFPVGPFALLDEVGLDVSAKVAPILHEAFGERMRPATVTDTLLADGRSGRKNGRGFYLYNRRKRGGHRPVDRSVYSLLGVSPSTETPAAEIIDRTVLVMINEAAHCLDDGIIRNARDGDIGAVYGIGFPPFRGGPLRYLDSRGPGEVVRRLEALRQAHGSRFEPAPLLQRLARDGGTVHAGASAPESTTP